MSDPQMREIEFIQGLAQLLDAHPGFDGLRIEPLLSTSERHSRADIACTLAGRTLCTDFSELSSSPRNGPSPNSPPFSNTPSDNRPQFAPTQSNLTIHHHVLYAQASHPTTSAATPNAAQNAKLRHMTTPSKYPCNCPFLVLT